MTLLIYEKSFLGERNVIFILIKINVAKSMNYYNYMEFKKKTLDHIFHSITLGVLYRSRCRQETCMEIVRLCKHLQLFIKEENR